MIAKERAPLLLQSCDPVIVIVEFDPKSTLPCCFFAVPAIVAKATIR